mmetsp:Transcript_33387/g.76226  ORF Transcript_33387/g.76226 Transcript_33387/m.76226 type:complete len:527 (-) Transcript_33387:75-1655(-)
MANYCPVVLTACQEAEKLKPKTWNTKYKLWKLKINEPHLFAHADASVAVEGQPKKEDTSFKPIMLPGGRGPSGWYWHAEKQFYFEKAAERCLWLDPATGLHHELHVGDDFSGELSLTGSAASKPPPTTTATSGSKAAPPSSQAPSTAARHLMILDLHKAAEVFKLESLHLARPAAMLAVYHSCEGSLPPETAAKTLHEKVLRKLAAHRSRWSAEALQAVLVECMQAVAEEQKCPRGIAAAVALILGLQLVVATSHGSACIIADPLPDNIRDVRAVSVSAPGAEVCTAVVDLDVRSAACIMLQTGAGLSEGTDAVKVYNEDSARAAAAHVTRGRSRAGCAALLRGMASRQVSAASNAAACLQLQWMASADVDDDLRPAKRAKTSSSDAAKDRVRCRQILLKHAGCKAPRDPVRRKVIQRSVAQAEAELLDILEELEAARSTGGTTAAEEIFTKKCRAVSECTSSLKGGDLAGDVGWLRLPEVRVGERLTKEQAVKMAFVKSAMALEIGDVSDIISSEDGLHLLKRTA